MQDADPPHSHDRGWCSKWQGCSERQLCNWRVSSPQKEPIRTRRGSQLAGLRQHRSDRTNTLNLLVRKVADGETCCINTGMEKLQLVSEHMQKIQIIINGYWQNNDYYCWSWSHTHSSKTHTHTADSLYHTDNRQDSHLHTATCHI